MPEIPVEMLEEYKIRCLFYGPSGSGKTYLCGTAVHVPELWPVLFVDTDGGSSTLLEVVRKYHPERIRVWRLDEHRDDLIMKKIIFGGESPFKTVVIDSLTEYYNWLMDMHLEAEGKLKFAPEGFVNSRQSRSLRDFGVVFESFLGFLREVKTSAKVHFLATAAEGLLHNDKTGELLVAPSAVGQLKDHLPGQFQLVGRLSVEVYASDSGRLDDVTHRMQLMPFRDRVAKARLVRQVPMLEDPTMEKVLNMLYNRGTTLQDSAVDSGVDVESKELPFTDDDGDTELPTQNSQKE